MVDPRGNSPKEIDLETLFAESFSALPPDEVVEKVNPFRRAVNRVLIGMALCTLTLNFCGLNYILPTVGMVLSLLGFLVFFGREVFDWCRDTLTGYKRRRDWENRNR